VTGRDRQLPGDLRHRHTPAAVGVTRVIDLNREQIS
jgi:hypothetical protein